jgi:hypothetical protein
MKNLIYFLLSFLIVFLLGLASLNAETCDIYFNAKSNTKIAYRCHDKINVIDGNSDICVIIKNTLVPLVPYYIKTAQLDHSLQVPSTIELDTVHEYEFIDNRYHYVDKTEGKKAKENEK